MADMVFDKKHFSTQQAGKRPTPRQMGIIWG